MDFKFDTGTVKRIFEASEGAITTIGRRDVYGHTGERHSAITKADLAARGHIATAFMDFKQAVDVGVKVFNAIKPEALEAVYYAQLGSAAAKFGANVDIGERIHVRLANYVGHPLGTTHFHLAMVKNINMPCCFMIITFYPVATYLEKMPP